MLVSRSRLNNAIELLKQNHSDLLATMQDLVDDWVRSEALKRNRYQRWRIARNQAALHKAVAATLIALAHLAEPTLDSPARAEFMGHHYQCLHHTRECWQELRVIRGVMNRFPGDPRISLLRKVVAELVESFDETRPVELRDWPTSANLIADYMAAVS